MTRWCIPVLACLAVVVAASGHFVYVVPDASGEKAIVVFSDSLAPDKNPELLEKIAQTKLWLKGDKDAEIAWKKTETAYEIEVPGKGTRIVGGVCEYGVFQRGDNPPSLLTYYPKAILGKVGPEAAKPWGRLPLELLPRIEKDTLVLTLIAGGKPVADVEVNVLAPGNTKLDPLKTNDKGEVTVKMEKAGMYGVRALHAEKKEGTLGDKKYSAVRSYATLVLHAGPEKAAAATNR